MILAVFSCHGLIFWHGPSPSLSWAGHVASTSSFQICQACSWPTPRAPPPVPSPLSSANEATLFPFSIPASWCMSPVRGGWVAMAAMKGWCGGGPPWRRAPDLPRKGGCGPGPGKCFSRSPQACPHPTLALCPHRVHFKSSQHTEKGMSWGGNMPRPFRAQVQYSRTNLKCHLGQFCSQPAKSWFIYIVGYGGRPRTQPCHGVRNGWLGAPAVAPWPGPCSEPPSGKSGRQRG